MNAKSLIVFMVILLTAFVGGQVWAADQMNTMDNSRGNTGLQPQPGYSTNVNNQFPMGSQNISSSNMSSAYVAFENLKGKEIKNAQGDTLGTIENVVIGSDGQARYAIISHGGILGIGETLTPVPWSVIDEQLSQSMAKDQPIVVNLTKDQLDNAPKYAENGDNNFDNPQWSQKVHAFFPQEQKAMNNESGNQSDQMAGQRFCSARDIIGKDVQNTGGEKLGSVENIVFSNDGRATYVLISPSTNQGTLSGNNVRVVPVPWSAVTFSQKEKGNVSLTLNIGKDRLANAPSIERDDYAQFDNPQWNQRVHSYYDQRNGKGMMNNSNEMMQRNQSDRNNMMQKSPEGTNPKVQ